MIEITGRKKSILNNKRYSPKKKPFIINPFIKNETKKPNEYADLKTKNKIIGIPGRKNEQSIIKPILIKSG